MSRGNRSRLIAFATQANQSATDGDQRNSPFTAALLRNGVPVPFFFEGAPAATGIPRAAKGAADARCRRTEKSLSAICCRMFPGWLVEGRQALRKLRKTPGGPVRHSPRTFPG